MFSRFMQRKPEMAQQDGFPATVCKDALMSYVSGDIGTTLPERAGSLLPADDASIYSKLRRTGRPCWPVVWLWVLSIAQYAYRYVLQVNDPRTSHLYGSTPPHLSALKYEIFFVFAMYSLYRLWRRPAVIGRKEGVLAWITALVLFALVAVFLVRLAVSPGRIRETVLCSLEFLPWVGSVFLIPFVFNPTHDVTQTLTIFERVSFWVVFPFWAVTVALAISGIRYPALSYPGLLLRFGGILDDPNGYACLCLFLLVLSVSSRTGLWRLRVLLYTAMVLGTLSFAGYVTAAVMCLLLLTTHLAGRRRRMRSAFRRVAVTFATVLFLGCALLSVYETDQAATAIDTLYTSKSNSVASHVSDLLPDDSMLDASSPLDLLCGVGGFSENFYWRILLNFGWVGLLSVITLIALWLYSALFVTRQWLSPIGAWMIGTLIGSNGIAYLLTFPLNLIFWSLAALLIRGGEQPLFPAAKRNEAL
jgi:hypothetical protein